MAMRNLAISWISGGGGSLTHGISVLEEYLSVEPGDAEVRRYLVSNLLRVGETDRARTWAEDLPPDPESLALRARAMADLDPAAATDLATRAIELDPEQLDARAVLARLAEASGDFDGAYRHARRVVEVNPFVPKDYSRVIRLARYRGDDETMGAMAEALEISGSLVQIREAGKLPLLKELQLVERLGVLVSSDSVAYRTRQAMLLIATGRLEEHPNWAAFHAVLGRIELQDASRREAVIALERALDLAPWEPEWRRLVANILRLEGQIQRADRLLNMAPRIPREEAGPQGDGDVAVGAVDGAEDGPDLLVVGEIDDLVAAPIPRGRCRCARRARKGSPGLDSLPRRWRARRRVWRRAAS